jgi:hypothetical protein
MFLPGVRIPISRAERLLEEMPDYVLLLAWNLRDEIIDEQSPYLEAGGKFIVPIPNPVILGRESLGEVSNDSGFGTS